MDRDRSRSAEPTLLGAVWRYRWLSLFIITLFVTAGVAYSSTRPISYVANASLVIEDPRTTTLFGSLVGVSPTRYIEDQVAVLRSGSVAERAAEILKTAGYSDLSPTAVSASITISSTGVSNFVGISYRSADAAVAVAGANAVAEAYQDVRRSESIRNASSALGQLDQKISGIEADLVAIRSSINDLRSTASGSLGLDQQFEAAVQRVAILYEALNTVGLTDEQRAELDDLVEEFATLRVISTIESETPEISALLREQASAIDRRSDLQARRDEIEIDAELVSAGVALYSPALGAFETGQDLLRTLALSVVLGGLVAVAVPYALAIRRRGFESRLQPAALLGVPLLAEVPDFSEERLVSTLPVRDAPQSVAAESFRFGITGIELQMVSGAGGGIPSGSGNAKSLMISSARVGDGKTTVTANIALAAARRGSRVLVIDADFGGQQLHLLLEAPNHDGPGLTDVVELGFPLTKAVEKIALDGAEFDLLSRGQVPITAPEFFRSAAAAAFFEAARDEYELVLIDSPPLLQVAYASILARYADMALIVVPHGSDLAAIEDVRDRMDLVGTPMAGYVYNRAHLRIAMTGSGGSMADVLGRTTSAPTN